MKPTKADLERIYWGEGKTWKQIGDDLGYTGGAVHRWAQQHGIPSRNPRPMSEATRQKLSEVKRGAPRARMSAQARQNMSEASKGHPVSQEQREWERQHFTGRVFSAETRQRMSEAQRRKAPPSEETKARQSAAMKQLWREPGARKRWANVCAGRTGRDNSRFGITPPLSASHWHLTVLLPDGREVGFRSRSEARAAHALTAAGMPWEYEQYRFSLTSTEGTYCPDFYLPTIDCFLEVGGRDDERKQIKRAHFRADYPDLRIVEWGYTETDQLTRGVVTVHKLLENPRAGFRRRMRIAPLIVLSVVDNPAR